MFYELQNSRLKMILKDGCKKMIEDLNKQEITLFVNKRNEELKL